MTNKSTLPNETLKKGINPLAILKENLKKVRIEKDNFDEDVLTINLENAEVMLNVRYNKGSDTVDGEFWVNEDEEVKLTEELEAELLHKFNKFDDNTDGVFTTEDYIHFNSLTY